MKAFSILALAATAKLVSAHATVMAVWINDEDQGLGNGADGYIRSPPSNSPITDVTSTDMTCNVNGATAAAKTLSVKSGDKITFEWHHNSRDASDDIIDLSHLGPVMVYMAETEKGSAGSGWVKIAEDGYEDGTWAVKTLVENKGKHSVTVPDVPAGDYLFRPEIIALHEGNRQGGAQFYMECVQVSVTSDGSSTLPEGVSIPGAYTATDPGVLFDIYSSFTSYPIPGPAVWDGASSGSGSGSGSSSTSAAATSSAPAATSSEPAATTTTTSEPAATSSDARTSTTSSEAVIPTAEPSTSEAPSSTSAAAEPEDTSCPNDDDEDYEETTTVTTTTTTTTSAATVAPTTAPSTTSQAVIPTAEPSEAPSTSSSAAEPEDTSCPNDDDDDEYTVTSTPVVTPTPKPTGFSTSVRPTSTSAAPAPTGSSGANKEYQQCGGINFKGTAGCESGLTCKQWNPYYYQCIKA